MPFVRTRVPEQWAFNGTCYMTRPVLLEPQHLGIVKKNVLARRSHGSDGVRETYPLQLMLENARILLVNSLQSSRSTFSWGGFLRFFAFKKGMLDTQISAPGGWPTVSARYWCSGSSVQQPHRPVYRNSIHLQRADNPFPTQISGQGSGHFRVHAVLGMSTILPATLFWWRWARSGGPWPHSLEHEAQPQKCDQHQRGEKEGRYNGKPPSYGWSNEVFVLVFQTVRMSRRLAVHARVAQRLKKGLPTPTRHPPLHIEGD